MKKFMFYTMDGYTQDTELNETNNCQLLGFSNGKDVNDAYNNLVKENFYMLKHNYKNIMQNKE